MGYEQKDYVCCYKRVLKQNQLVYSAETCFIIVSLGQISQSSKPGPLTNSLECASMNEMC